MGVRLEDRSIVEPARAIRTAIVYWEQVTSRWRRVYLRSELNNGAPEGSFKTPYLLTPQRSGAGWVPANSHHTQTCRRLP